MAAEEFSCKSEPMVFDPEGLIRSNVHPWRCCNWVVYCYNASMRKLFSTVAASFALLLLFGPLVVQPQAPAGAAPAGAAPAGTAGSDAVTASLVNTVCASCHTLDRVNNKKADSEAWTTTVTRMQGKGADLTDAQVPLVVEYLARTSGTLALTALDGAAKGKGGAKGGAKGGKGGGKGGGGGGGGSSQFPAVSGYPHITVPAGFYRGLPMGISFYGRAWSESVLIRIAFAFEQATKARKAPTFIPTIVLS